MSVDSFFFIRDENLPTIAKWQQALDSASTGIVLEDVGDLRSHTGYLPATHRGHESGFEWFYGPVLETFGDSPSALGDRGHAINCVTHSDMRELVCGIISCSILVQLADGLFFDEESEEALAPEVGVALGCSLESKLR